LRRLANTPPSEGPGDLAPGAVEEFARDYREALADDLNTARALGALHTLLRQINTALDGNGISETVRNGIDGAFDLVKAVLDIIPGGNEESLADQEIQELVEQRTAARTDRDFARADEIRDRLTEMGIVVEDTPHGAVWHRKN